jgi:hypothetical protein
MLSWLQVSPRTPTSAVGTLFCFTSNPRTCYIAREHANKTSFCPKNQAQTFFCSSWRGAQYRISNWSHSQISIKHNPLTMELGLRWVFLVAVLKGDLWITRYWVCKWTCVRRTIYMCESFLTRILCLCRCPVWGATGGVWGRLGTTWGIPESLLCSLQIHL